MLFVKQALAAPKVVLFEGDEILVLEFSEILPHGVGVLKLGFNGELNDKMKGFYRRWSIEVSIFFTVRQLEINSRTILYLSWWQYL